MTRRSARRTVRTARGFSIIEALISIMLLMIAILGILAAIPSSFNNTVRDSERVQAVAAGQQYLDALQEYVTFNGSDANLPSPPAISADAGGIFEGTGSPAVSPGQFTITNNGCPAVSGSTAEYDCQVYVKWTENGVAREVDLESYVTSQAN